MKNIVFIVAAIAACGTAAADDTLLYAKQNCDLVARSATAFHNCHAANLGAANKALDDTYRALMAQKTFYVGSPGALRDVERAWIVYKDKECNYEYGDGASSDENYWLAHADCEIRVTEQRIRELQGRPSCTGGASVCYPHMR